MIEIIDENTIRTSLWGIVRFKLAPKGRNDRWICSHCLLLRSQTEEECGQIPCCASRRSDGLNGYFSIQCVPIEPLFPPNAFS